MKSIYGNVLDHFSEFFQTTQFWTMKKLAAGGFETPSNIRKIDVIVLNDVGYAIKRKKIIEEWVLDISGNDVIYAYADSKIMLGDYLFHPNNGDWFTVVTRLDFSIAGGFMSWGIQKVQGEDFRDTNVLEPMRGIF